MSRSRIQPGKQAAASAPGGISDQQVLDFLKLRPDFFRQHPEAIANLSLPHNSGSAVSLVERQVAVLRERGIQARRKLSELIDIAKDNDQLFEYTQELVITLLKAADPDTLYSETVRQFSSRFDVEQTAIICIGKEGTGAPEGLDAAWQRDAEQAGAAIGHLLENKQSFCGLLRDDEASFIFGNADTVGSAAVAWRPIPGGTRLLIAVANSDQHHYSEKTGTLFLDYVADVLALRTRQLAGNSD